MLKVLLILSLLCTVAHSNIIVRGRGLDDSGSTAGESKGSWVLLGSMCFDAKTEDELTIVATGLAEGSNQRILFYDDESGSFANAVGAKSCAEKVKHAKQLSYVDKDGKTVTLDGVDLVKDQKKTQKIKISEQYKHQWYFVASNCGDTVETEKPVNVEYSITSNLNVDCSILFAKASVAGYIVACIFMVIMVFLLAGLSYCFYVKSKPPSLPSMKDNTGYNEL